MKPTREIILSRKYNNEIEQDVSEMIWCIFGTAVHSIIEQAEADEYQFKEEKLKYNLGNICKELDGYYLSGRSDMIDLLNKKIIDWKTASCWKVIYQDYEDWRKELLIYAWLVKKLGFEIDSGEIVAFLKDFSKTKAKVDSTYPQLPVFTIDFNFKDKDYKEIEQFIINKFLEIKNYENVEDTELPICSQEERWNDGDKYAVKKIKNKTATKIHDTLEDAQQHLDNLEKDYPGIYEIETRKGTDKKCIDYCSCCKYCKYYKENYMKEGI